MKIFLTVILSILLNSLSISQWPEDFDSYAAGQKFVCQNPPNWTTWNNLPCSAEDPYVTNKRYFSWPNSIVIVPDNDLVKVINNYTTGYYSLSFKKFIPDGRTGYFNVLHFFNGVVSQWGMECYFNLGGNGVLYAGLTPTYFTWIPNQWIEVGLNVNLDFDEAKFYYNNVLINSWAWHLGSHGTGTLCQLGGFNFFGFAATDSMYVDSYCHVPVELVSFTSINDNNNVILNWTTATEINNKGFEIERKGPDSIFITLGFIEGNGSTTEPNHYIFTDINVPVGIYLYRLKQIDFNGTFGYYEAPLVTIKEPSNYLLMQNYPNPFNPSTQIKYSIARDDFINLSVYNAVGQKVAGLVNENQTAGNYSVQFNGENQANGVYFLRLETGQYSDTKKMILMK